MLDNVVDLTQFPVKRVQDMFQNNRRIGLGIMGLADLLFGDVPFTGRLSMSWPENVEQEPINYDDPVYKPLYAFGYHA